MIDLSLPKSICIGRIITEYVSNETSDNIDDVRSWSTFPGGSAANVAFGLAKLGCPSTFIGCVGEDAAGGNLKHSLEEAGIDVSGIRVAGKTETGWLWTLRHPNGDRSFHAPQVSFDHFADAHLSAFDIDGDRFTGASYLLPQSAHLGLEGCREALYFALALAARNKIQTVFDVNYRTFPWKSFSNAKGVTKDFSSRCNYLKLSVEEAEALFNTSSISKLSNLFTGAKGILLTKGGAGCDYVLFDNAGTIPGFKVPVVDSTGAGDAFVAGFVSMLVKHGETSLQTQEGCREFMRFANAAGAICVSKMGAVNSLPTEEEILSLCKTASI